MRSGDCVAIDGITVNRRHYRQCISSLMCLGESDFALARGKPWGNEAAWTVVEQDQGQRFQTQCTAPSYVRV